MNNDWMGKSVSLNCGGLGFYQGVIHSVQLEEQTITLKKAFQNGRMCNVPSVTLNASDIKDLQFLDAEPEARAAKPKASVVAVPKKIKPRTPTSNSVASQIAAGGSNSNYNNNGGQTNKPRTTSARFSPAIAAALPGMGGHVGSGSGRDNRNSPRKMFGDGHRTPNSRRERDRMQRDEDCFGEINEDEMIQEFDFEKNLALFDKRTVFEEIEHDEMTSNQPDIIRLIDANRRKPEAGKKAEKAEKKATKGHGHQPEPKYRNDENVLGTIPAQYRQIETGEMSIAGEFVTDTGLVVPAVSLELRQKLEREAKAKGFGLERIVELMARGTVELSIQLFGGAHRLNPTNSHQIPTVVVLAGPNRAGVFGVAAARHLVSQGVKTIVFLPDLPHFPPELQAEHALYKLSGGLWTTKPKDLPLTPVDLIITAMEDQEMWQQERSQPWLRAGQRWAVQNFSRTPVLAIDPPSAPDEPILPIKVCLVPGLPLWYGDGDAMGKLHSANLSIPAKIFKLVGIKYSSPYGSKTVLPLHKVN